MESITHTDIRKMLIGAYLQILSQKDRINKINLFPVPDQDTGNNLVKTLKGMYDAVENSQFSDMQSLRHEALEGALTTAAGNAGIITASFFSGFLETMPDKITTSILAKAFANGSIKAYESVQEPKKGTILDVMNFTAERLAHVPSNGTVREVLQKALVSSQEALNATKTQMDIYRKSSVVDAGGLGFTFILEGFLLGLSHNNLRIPTKVVLSKPSKVLVEITSQQYEVVALLDKLRNDKDSILQKLIPHGDCIDIVEINDKMKIHIHTDHPNTVVDMITDFGTVIQMKTVDMNIGENEEMEDGRKNIGIVTDEGAAISLAYSTQHDISLVPFQLSWDSMDAYTEMRSMNMYEKMRFIRNKSSVTTLPKTSQPSSYAFLKAFKDQLQKYQDVVCVVTSSAVSGTYNSALHARNQLSTSQKERVQIPDLKQALGGQTLLIRSLVDHIQQQYNVQTIIRHLTKTARGIDVFGFGHDAYWLMKGGRLGPNKAKALTTMLKLGIQPIVGVKSGKLGVKGFAKRRRSMADMAYRYIMSHYGNSEEKYNVVIHHSDVPNEVAILADKLSTTQFEVVDIALLSPIVGVHIGPDAMVLAICKI